MQTRRVNIYQITNNATEDVCISPTASALYKRIYRHKHDANTWVRSKLCDLMRSLGQDKFKIQMFEEGAFSCADAVNAKETLWALERRCSLNESSPTGSQFRRTIGSNAEEKADDKRRNR